MLRDSDFLRGTVPMTKEEVRAVVMAKAVLREDSCIIDVGAGTGSLAVQAALIAKKGIVFAIEHNPEAIKLLQLNQQKHQVENLIIIGLSAPEALLGLPEADGIIIGGSGGRLQETILACDKLLVKHGKIVVTSVTLGTLGEAVKYFSKLKYNLDICQVAVTKYHPVNAHLMAKAYNPVFIITAAKEVEENG